MSRSTEFPRAYDSQRWSKEEHAIQNAIDTVEQMGADPILTDAVCLLLDARKTVARYVDGERGA